MTWSRCLNTHEKKVKEEKESAVHVRALSQQEILVQYTNPRIIEYCYRFFILFINSPPKIKKHAKYIFDNTIFVLWPFIRVLLNLYTYSCSPSSFTSIFPIRMNELFQLKRTVDS